VRDISPGVSDLGGWRRLGFLGVEQGIAWLVACGCGCPMRVGGYATSDCSGQQCGVRRGSVTTRRAPPCGWLVAVTLPSWAVTISLAMATPRPAPSPRVRLRELSRRLNRSKIGARSCSGMLGPSSVPTGGMLEKGPCFVGPFWCRHLCSESVGRRSDACWLGKRSGRRNEERFRDDVAIRAIRDDGHSVQVCNSRDWTGRIGLAFRTGIVLIIWTEPVHMFNTGGCWPRYVSPKSASGDAWQRDAS
jgi:hypothetical protein